MYLKPAERRTLDVRAMRNKTENALASAYEYSKGKGIRPSPPNRKVGAPQFNLPALVSCPNATPACGAACYAQAGHYAMKEPPKMYWGNWVHLHLIGPHRWVEALRGVVLAGLHGQETGHFRLHSSGDFFSQEYFDAWCAVARSLPRVRFWAYTRTTTLDLSQRPDNLVIYASADHENMVDSVAFASRWGIKMAYMGEETAELSGRASFACPEQQGKVASCVACGLCVHGRGKDVSFAMH